jgi:uncharacterized protein YceH (UPF0502 family)
VGNRDDRFVHLLCGERDLTAIATKRSQTHTPISSQANEQIEAHEKRISDLEEKVEFLISELDLELPANDE